MADTSKIDKLQSRLAAEQRTFILQAAEAGILPPSGALVSIAALEGALSAIEALVAGDAREAQPPTRPAPSPSSGQPPAPTGTVKWFNAAKGFGFIVQDGGGPDAFVHISAVERAGMTGLTEGQKIAYELVADRRTGKQSADKLKAV